MNAKNQGTSFWKQKLPVTRTESRCCGREAGELCPAPSGESHWAGGRLSERWHELQPQCRDGGLEEAPLPRALASPVPASPSHSVAAKPAVGELIRPRSASRQACFPQQLPRLSQSPEVWRPAGHLVSQTAGLASAPAPQVTSARAGGAFLPRSSSPAAALPSSSPHCGDWLEEARGPRWVSRTAVPPAIRGPGTRRYRTEAQAKSPGCSGPKRPALTAQL